jgi:hypothetical protein
MAQNQSFEEAMEFALHIHDTASVFESELEAVKAFERVAQEHEKAWLPQYWASYLYTQIGRLAARLKLDKDPMAYIDLAQQTFDSAENLLPKMTNEQESSFHALQHLIYMFRSRFSEGKEAQKYTALAEDELNESIKANPRNPLVYVMVGTSLINEGANSGREGESTTGMEKILAGNVLLKEAKRVFEIDTRKHSMTTHWNQEWLPFWLPYSERLLKGEKN